MLRISLRIAVEFTVLMAFLAGGLLVGISLTEHALEGINAFSSPHVFLHRFFVVLGLYILCITGALFLWDMVTSSFPRLSNTPFR